MTDLQSWDERVNDVAAKFGLDPFPIVYEVCDYYSMIGHMSYSGLPSMYNHWSFGKDFERTLQMYNAGHEGLPYELIINSDPSIAYLMRENPLYLQILIMAHCIGHSDFFKNNRLFKNTNPSGVLSRSKSAKKRIQSYIEDPSVGINKVEEILDAAHSLRWQCDWYGRERVPYKIQRKELIEKIKEGDESVTGIDPDVVPIEPDYDILGFLAEHGSHLDGWQKDIIQIVRERSIYYVPQMRTKILNEGWASFWHYKIMHELNLPQEFHIPFLKTHNQVVQPIIGRINPYHLGLYLFQKIEKERGIDECFFVRETMHDETAIMQYLDEEMCLDLNLFSFSSKKDKNEKTGYYSIDEVSDDDGWELVKMALVKQTGLNLLPAIYVKEVDSSGCLILTHDHDGRDLELTHADQVVKHTSTLWEDAVKLFTVIEGEPFEI
jgi:stage V sporulation protein R